MMAVKEAAGRIAGPSYVGARHCLEKLHTRANEWNARQRAECYHADVVVHEPPAVDFTAVGLQNVLSQCDGQVIVQQPNVPQQICQIKRETS